MKVEKKTLSSVVERMATVHNGERVRVRKREREGREGKGVIYRERE